MCLGASLRGLQPEVAFPQDYHGDCTRLIFVSHSMDSSNALKKLAEGLSDSQTEHAPGARHGSVRA